MKNIRDNRIDCIKGFGILLVILGHTLEHDDIVRKIIYSFHMPLFFIVSGYVYNKKKYDEYKIKEFFYKKFKVYIMPYLYLGIINLILFQIIKPILNNNYSLSNYFYEILKKIIGIIYSIGDTTWMPNCSPIWFLTCLFSAEIIFFIIMKYSKSEKKHIILIGIIGLVTSYLFNIRLPWNVDVAFTAVVFIYIGYIIKNRINIKNIEIKKCILIFVLFVISVKYNGNVSFSTNKYSNIIYMYIGAISASILIFKLFWKFKSNIFLERFGKNTIIVIGFNYAVLNISNKLLNILNFSDKWYMSFVIQIIIFLLIFYIWDIINKFLLPRVRDYNVSIKN